MDMVWVDTMFPGIDEEDGWEKNLERVVNYDYLLKEYLDWQLKHLTTDNFDQVDWANVTADIISMAAGQIDLTAYYTADEVDNIAQLILTSAEGYATAELSAKIGDIGSATVKAYADAQIAGLSLAAVSSGGTAQLVLQSGGSTISGSGASLALSVTNNSTSGYSTLALTAGGVTLATSGNITLGGKVVFTDTDISDLSSSSGIYQGVTTIIGGTVTANYVNALGITANDIVANASISSPTISGGLIIGSTFYSSDRDSYFMLNPDGWSLYQKVSGSWYEKACLEADSSAAKLSLGNDHPAVFKKYWDGSNHYLWLGDSNQNHGLLINLNTGAYSFS